MGRSCSRRSSAKSRQDMLADIGLGKRLSRGRRAAAAVARRRQRRTRAALPGSVMIRGSEGMAVQFAKCCKPIPGDPIIGLISKGQGMVIHTHDCPVIGKTRPDPGLGARRGVGRRRRASRSTSSIKLVVANQRGVLAKVAAEIAERRIEHPERRGRPGGRRNLHRPCTSRCRSPTACTSRRSCAACAASPK